MSMNKEELKELAATLNGIANGKAWEVHYNNEWHNATGDPLGSLRACRNIRLKPWSLPPPPDGYEWHCGDEFTEKDLQGGWRPLFVGERRQVGDQFYRIGGWVEVNPHNENHPMSPMLVKHRTKRPLPLPQQHDPYAELKAAHADGKTIQIKISSGWFDWPADRVPEFKAPPQSYRIKPETRRVNANPVRIPLCADDIKSGDEFLAPDETRYQWNYICSEIIDFVAFSKLTSELMEDGWKIRSIGETEWRECSKEEEVEA